MKHQDHKRGTPRARWALLAAALLAGPAGAADVHVFKNARVWTGDGPPVNDGVLVVRDGKVAAVGARGKVTVPADAEVHDLGGAVVIPGLVVAETTLGEGGRDDEESLTPHFRAVDGFDFYGEYRDALAGGVTTVQISPGSKRLVPGQGAVVKLAGAGPKNRTLRERERLRVVLGDGFKNPPRIYESPIGAVADDKPLKPTSPQLASSLGSAVAGLRATFRAGDTYRKLPAEKRKNDDLLTAVGDCLAAGRGLRVTAPGAADVRAALNLSREFGVRVLLVGPEDVRPFRDHLASWAANVEGVSLSARVRPGRIADLPTPRKDAPKPRMPWDDARDLLAAGCKVAIHPAADDDLGEMLFLGGLFTGGGLSDRDVLRMLTLAPAELLGVSDRVGSLAPGKDADFVVLSGAPFATRSRVRSVYVGGKLAHAAKEAETATVIRAGRVYTGDGTFVPSGAVLVQGAKVRGVGRDVSAPADAVVCQFRDAVIVPGFLDLYTGLGLGGPLRGTVPLQTKLGEHLTSGDPEMAVARRGGVTTVLLGPTGPATGPVVAFKLGDTPRVLRDPVALRFAVSGNLTSQGSSLRNTLRSAKSYVDGWAKYEADLAEFEKKKAAPAKPGEKKEEPKAPTKPTVVENLEPYRPLFAGTIPALVEAERAGAIKLAVTIFRDEYKLRTVLTGGDDAFRMADFLAGKQVGVAVGPDLVRTVDRSPVNLAQVLANHRIPFGFQSKATTGAQTLPLAVQYAVRKGLGTDDALAGMTSGAAKLLSLDGVGTLAVGKDADLVVLSGPPFELSSRVLAVMIDGQWVYRAEDDQ